MPNKEDVAILSYVHREMDEADRQAFERQVAKDPDLKGRVMDAQRFHVRMKSLCRLAAISDDQLVDWILDDMNRERSALPRDENVIPFPSKRPQQGAIRAYARRIRWMAALAAGVLLWLGVNMMVQPLTWRDPVILQQVDYRQPGEPAFESRYTSDQLREPLRRLETGCVSAYHESAKRPWWNKVIRRSDWQLSVTVQEMNRGRIVLGVEAAHARVPDVSRNWTGMYRDIDEFGMKAEEFGRQIGAELAAAGERHE